MDKHQQLLEKIRQFTEERDWKQFHNHKDMAIALSIEASELLEHFLWKRPEELETISPEELEEIKEELADVFVYLSQLSDNLGVDLFAAAEAKIEKNKKKYPVEKVKGRHKKYTKL